MVLLQNAVFSFYNLQLIDSNLEQKYFFTCYIETLKIAMFAIFFWLTSITSWLLNGNILKDLFF